MYNPRWPYKFCVYDTNLDENGIPMTDSNGDPLMTRYLVDSERRRLTEKDGKHLTVPKGPMQLERVICDSRGNPTFHADGTFVTEVVEEMPWGYRTSTGGIKDSGEVFRTDFKISCPMMLTHLEEGTILNLTDATHTFVGIVKKMTTYNWGTNIWLDRQGNDRGPEQ